MRHSDLSALVLCNSDFNLSKLASQLLFLHCLDLTIWNEKFTHISLSVIVIVCVCHMITKYFKLLFPTLKLKMSEIKSELQKKIPRAVVYYYCPWYLVLRLRRYVTVWKGFHIALFLYFKIMLDPRFRKMAFDIKYCLSCYRY